MELAIGILIWTIGATFGALSVSAAERGAHESAWRYRLYMAYFFSMAIVLMLCSTVLGLGAGEMALLGLLALVALAVSVVVGGSQRATRRGP